MNICNKHGVEICFVGPDCPACQMREEIDKLQDVIITLAEHVTELQEQIDKQRQ